MELQAPTRRQFLQSTTRIGVTLTLAAALCPPARPARANSVSLLPVSQGTDVLNDTDVLQWIASGVGSLWVAGHVVNSFAHNLNYANLPKNLKDYFRCAGSECRGIPKGKGVWETIPEQIRMGGDREIEGFLKNKDWSHNIPKSQGGSSTADNGIFELTELNRRRGDQPMTQPEIDAARKVIRSDMIRSVLRQTTSAMVKGALAGIILGGLLLCLECGLSYAEGKITWEQMVRKIVRASALAGLFAFIITGLIVGLGILFPPLIPILALVLFVLQIVSLVFLAYHAVKIAEGWWEVLKEYDLKNEFVGVLETVEDFVHEMVDDTDDSILNVVWEWIEGLAQRVGIDRAWEIATGFVQRIGIESAWNWFASQTRAVREQASVLLSSFNAWDFPDFDIDAGEMRKAIAKVINLEFREALVTTDLMRRSLIDNLGSAGREALKAS